MQNKPSSTQSSQPPAGHPKPTSRRSIRRWLLLIVPLTALILAATLVVDVKDLCAHSPHDAIDDLAMSPTYDRDRTLFIILIDQIQRSTDGGSSWKLLVNGLDHKHRLSTIAISPSYNQDNTLFLSSVGSGIFRSRDQGDSWARANNGLGTLDIGSMAVQPASKDGKQAADSLVVLAAGLDSGLFRSENSGDAWEQVSVAPASTGQDVRVAALAFAPVGDRKLPLKSYLGDDQGRLYLSVDGGITWTKIWDAPGSGAITAIAFSSTFASDGTLFVGTHAAGIWKSRDEGNSFVEANNGMPFSVRDRFLTLRKSREGPPLRPSELDVTTLAVSPNYGQDSTVLSALWNQAIFRSDNGGRIWKRYQLGLSCDYQADSEAYKSPHFRQIRLSNAFTTDHTAFAGGFDGLFKSTDGGRSWTQMETLPVKLIAGLATAPQSAAARTGAATEGSEPAHDGFPAIALTTYGGGIYTSGDGGQTWQIHNKGLTTTRLTDIVFSPNFERDGTILTASYGRLVESNLDADDEQPRDTWNEIAFAQKSWRTYVANHARQIGVPSILTRMLLTEAEKEKPYPTVFALSPRFGFSTSDGGDRTLYFGTRRHGIFRSLDGGRTVAAVWNDAPAPGLFGRQGTPALVSSLAISPNFATAPGQGDGDRTLFAGIYGEGVLKTTDGGETWQEMNRGLTFLDRWQSEDMGYALERQNIRLAISPNFGARGKADDQTLFVGSGDGLFKTIDGGENWQELTVADLDRVYVVALAISPNYDHDQTILVNVRGRGLYKSQDGGTTFTSAGTELTDNNYSVRWLSLSPHFGTDHTILAASDEELLASVDRGSTWQIIDRPVRYEDNREVIRFEGAWTTVQAHEASARTVTYSDAAGSKATLPFVGTGARWIGAQASDGGIARVYLDGRQVGTVDQYTDQPKPIELTSASDDAIFAVTGLAYGPHTLVIEVTGDKNPASDGHRLTVDAIDVFDVTAKVHRAE